MKKYVRILILIIWMLAACAPKPPEQSLLPNDDSYPNDSYPNQSYPNEDNSTPQLPIGMTPAISAAITALSGTLNLPPGQITVVSAEAVEWSDGCLGVQKPGVMCTQAIVPGYKIILEANGEQYEFHTDEDGSAVVQVTMEVFESVEAQVVNQLASNLGLDESDISIISNSDVEFADTCLGVAMPNIMCAEVMTSGKVIVLEAEAVQYEYHVSNDGTSVQPATLALTWTREGGIAGFCDSLTVFLSGEVYGYQCRSEPNETIGTFANLLSITEREQFDGWVNELEQVDLDASDLEGVSDRMEVKLTFYGQGSGSISKTDQQELLLWAQSLYQKLYA